MHGRAEYHLYGAHQLGGYFQHLPDDAFDQGFQLDRIPGIDQQPFDGLIVAFIIALHGGQHVDAGGRGLQPFAAFIRLVVNFPFQRHKLQYFGVGSGESSLHVCVLLFHAAKGV